MSETAILLEKLSKKYQLGTIGYGTFYRDLQAWWARARGKEDPNAPVNGPSRLDLRGDFWALKGVSLEIEQGDRVGIIGRNGAGKSTLLKILSQITRPTDGVAKIKGKVASLLEVGTGFHPELTGRENVFLNGAIMGMKRREIEGRFDEIVDFSGVEQFIDTPVKRYSSGMYVRLAFAVAAHLEPDILIVDEVLSVGDAAFQKKCLGKMDSASKKEGRTILVVSHNLQSILQLCNRGVLLQDGCVVMDGGMREVVDEYMNLRGPQNGEVSWPSSTEAPGDARVRLKAVRVISGNTVQGRFHHTEPFRIEVDFWNLEEGKRRFTSIHVVNSMGATVLISSNLPSMSNQPDPWFFERLPRGIVRTSCTIPGNVLNTGTYTISVGVVENRLPMQRDEDVSFWIPETLSFELIEKPTTRDFAGDWIGIVRMPLDWHTLLVEESELAQVNSMESQVRT